MQQQPFLRPHLHLETLASSAGSNSGLTCKWFHLTWELHCYLIFVAATAESLLASAL